MIILLVLIAFILLCLNGGKSIGVFRLISQVIKIILAIIVIKLFLMAIGFGGLYFLKVLFFP